MGRRFMVVRSGLTDNYLLPFTGCSGSSGQLLGREFASALVRAVFSQDVRPTSSLAFFSLLKVRCLKTGMRVPGM